MNQTALGAAIQVSFQQIQKYESGRDRISAATLLRIADVLKAPVAAFFDDGPLPSGDVAEMRESMRMAAAILRIRNPLIRKRISLLIDEVADVHSPASSGRLTRLGFAAAEMRRILCSAGALVCMWG